MERAGEGRYVGCPRPQLGPGSLCLRVASSPPSPFVHQRLRSEIRAQELRTCTAIFAGQVSAGDLEVDVTILTAWPLGDTGRPRRSATSARKQGPRRSLSSVASDAGPRSSTSVRRPCHHRWNVPLTGIRHRRAWNSIAALLDRVEGRGALGHAPWEEYEPTKSDTASWVRFDDPPLTEDGSLDPLGGVDSC